jgi:glycosylphosphatidylinositol transamidase (GPIT) subunit GPI8
MEYMNHYALRIKHYALALPTFLTLGHLRASAHAARLIGMLCIVLLAACSDKEDAPVVVEDSPIDIITLNVDVVLPADITNLWQDAIDLAQANIALAQQRLPQQVKLNLRYHDEHSENLDQLAFDLTHPKEGDDTCHAIIGPYHSSNAQTFLSYAAQTRLPVVMPTCTSAELQRTNARNTYAWFLTESDITQCEIMLIAGRDLGYKEAVLIHSDDAYGKSFADWFAYYATELQIDLPPTPTIAYQKGMDLEPFFMQAAEISLENVLLCVAVSDPDDILDIMVQADDFRFWPENNDSWPVHMDPICSDTSFDDKFFSQINTLRVLGITPVCSRSYGFWHYIDQVYGRIPHLGEGQMYDAITMIALGAAHQAKHGDHCLVNGEQVTYNEQPYGPGLTDHMRAVVSNTTDTPTSWTSEGLALAFNRLSQGRDIDVSGASGSLVFDLETNTKALNTPYMLWELVDYYDDEVEDLRKRLTPKLFLSTGGSNAESSTVALWEQQKQYYQDFTDVSVSHNLPELTDRWAVVISPSTSWENYRHQADAFAMYQTLRRHGYDDDHIVLIVEDNLADDPRNNYPGQIFVESAGALGDDVRQDAVVDYHFSQLTPDDLADILMGRQSERLPHVIHSDSTSNVFVFWSGHGGSEEGPLWGNEDSKEYFGTDRIRNIVEEMAGTANSSLFTLHSSLKKYRRMMLAIETCYSGHWGLTLEGQPDVVVLTAATPYESSKADVFDHTLGVYLSNAFARTFRRQINENNNICIYDLYRELVRTTPGSHVSLYNQKEYGSVYTESMNEFFK